MTDLPATYRFGTFALDADTGALLCDGEPSLQPVFMKPCAEILLTEKDAGYLMEQGIMPLASLKEQDAALLVRFQSIAQPVAALSGRWSG